MPRDLRALADDFIARKGEEEVDRKNLLRTLADFLTANDLKADWEGIENAPNEALVNALAIMSPYGAAEKQALLEAPDLKTRAEILTRSPKSSLPRIPPTAKRLCNNDVIAAPRPAIQREPQMSDEKAIGDKVDPKLLEILVCPLTKAALEYDPAKQELISRGAKLAYPNPRRHSDHAGGRGAEAGLVQRGLPPVSARKAKQRWLDEPHAENLWTQLIVERAEGDVAIGELNLKYERIDVGGAFGKNKEPDYLAMNPNGLVPTLDEDGFILWNRMPSCVIWRGSMARERWSRPTRSRSRAPISGWTGS